jgi:type IV secretion system protein VirB10
LNASRSEIRSLPVPPAPFLKVEESATAITLYASTEEGGPSAVMTYPFKGVEGTTKAGRSTMKTVTKWEGSALLVNTIVSGPENYTVMERWKRSRDGSTLTIRRTIVRLSGESESLLVYENPSLLAKAPTPETAPQTAPSLRPAGPPNPARTAESAAPQTYILESGTHILLRLVSSVNTKRTAPGDRIYLSTAVPVFVNGRLVVPRGSSVVGTITESKQAGRVKGRAALNVRFDSITLPNGVTRDLHSRPSSADTRGDLDRAEGRIKGEGNKGGDARTVGTTTATGAGIGAIAGGGIGAGIGAAAGAAAGLAGVFGSRGPQVILPEGSTMELTLDRDLEFTATELPPG